MFQPLIKCYWLVFFFPGKHALLSSTPPSFFMTPPANTVVSIHIDLGPLLTEAFRLRLYARTEFQKTVWLSLAGSVVSGKESSLKEKLTLALTLDSQLTEGKVLCFLWPVAKGVERK